MLPATAPSLVGVNLKMYFDHDATLAWCTRVAVIAREHPAVADGLVELVVLPSFPSLPAVVDLFSGSRAEVGTQNLHEEDAGPFTGEVSGVTLAQVGCRYVVVGHAERRRLFGEDDATVARKVAAALRNGLVPVLCVGEPESGDPEHAARLCVGQLDSALAVAERDGVTGPLVVAYEPGWAIGVDQAATPAHIAYVVAALRAALEGRSAATQARVIYGGSAGPGLLAEVGLTVDGLFLGRFAHDPAVLETVFDEFVERG